MNSLEKTHPWHRVAPPSSLPSCAPHAVTTTLQHPQNRQNRMSLWAQRENFKNRLVNQPKIQRPTPKPNTPRPDSRQSKKPKQEPYPLTELRQQEFTLGWAKVIDMLKEMRMPVSKPNIAMTLDNALAIGRMQSKPTILQYYYQKLERSDHVEYGTFETQRG